MTDSAPLTKQGKPKTSGRFYVIEEGNWCLVDSVDGTLVGHDTKKEALESMSFAIAYVRLHGDIDLCSFPYSLDDPLRYDKWDNREREYKEDLLQPHQTVYVVYHLSKRGASIGNWFASLDDVERELIKLCKAGKVAIAKDHKDNIVGKVYRDFENHKWCWYLG